MNMDTNVKFRTSFSNIIDLMSQRAEIHPDRTAVVFLQDGEIEAGKLNYGQLDLKSRILAAQIRTRVEERDRVLIACPSGIEYVISFFGCLYAGTVAIPAYPPQLNKQNQHTSRLKNIIIDAQPRVILTTQAYLKKVSAWIEREFEESSRPEIFVVPDIDSLESVPFSFLKPAFNDNDAAYLQYTSGSTGLPKGAVITHRNLMMNNEMIGNRIKLPEGSTQILWMPLYHDMGLVFGITHSIYNGSTTVMIPPVVFLQKPFCLLWAISKYRAVACGGPNFGYELCLEKIDEQQKTTIDLSSWIFAYNGAEPVRADTIDRFSEEFKTCGFKRTAFAPSYGMAEATLGISICRMPDEPLIRYFNTEALKLGEAIPEENKELGQPLVGCGPMLIEENVAIVDPVSFELCAESEIGEIWVAGKHIAHGYWNKKKETKETFQASILNGKDKSFLRTGDMGFVYSDQLFVTGRLKDMIIIHGVNFYPQDIEATVEKAHHALQRGGSAAFSIERDGVEKPVVVQEVKRSQIRKINTSEVFRDISNAVASAHGFKVFDIVLLKTAALPKTTSGKVRRRECKNRYLKMELREIARYLENKKEYRNPDITQEREKVTVLNTTLNYTRNEIEKFLLKQISKKSKLKLNRIDVKDSFAHYGIDSVAAAELSSELEKWLNRSLDPTIVYDYPNIAALSSYLASSSSIIRSQKSEMTLAEEGIAVVGIGCRFPGNVSNPDEYWNFLSNGKDAITEVPPERWKIEKYYNKQAGTPGKMNTRFGGFLKEVDLFDAEVFGISPKEASNMDPQQRLLLEVTWEALEHAHIPHSTLRGTQTGVFVGICTSDYDRVQSRQDSALNEYFGTGNALSIAANRLSYVFDFCGPSWAVDSACSSSLVAVHNACRSLESGESDIALAGGVNLILSPDITIALSQAKMMAPDGRCKTFDERADGYVRSEGCGMIVLQRVSDALKRKSKILAIIRGSAVNQDGHSNGLTAPNGESQKAVIRRALSNAGVTSDQISYFETHGTGTKLGDPIEVNALKDIVDENNDRHSPCYLGSVKTNLGHLEAAAGIAALIKVVLCMQNKKLVPSLHLTKLNPFINLDHSTMEIPTDLKEWNGNGEPLSAGISSFGFGGTNAHIVLQDYSKDSSVESDGISNRDRGEGALFVLSAHSQEALRQNADVCASFIQSTDEKISTQEICHSAVLGKNHLQERLAVPVKSKLQLIDELSRFGRGGESRRAVWGSVTENDNPQIAFIFTGQGSQYAEMGMELYKTQPIFRDIIDICDNTLANELPKSILTVLKQRSKGDSDLDNTLYTQPALFALEVALSTLWKSWGVEPDILLGHSVGEYSAACIAGVFDVETGIKIIAKRAELMSDLPSRGVMYAVTAPLEVVEKTIGRRSKTVDIAAINGESSLVLSGEELGVKDLAWELESSGYNTKKLTVSHAFHSHLMEPIMNEFGDFIQKYKLRAPKVKLISNVHGQIAGDEIATVDYWVDHVRKPVMYYRGIKTLKKSGCEIYVEVGPQPILLEMARPILGTFESIPSMRKATSAVLQMYEGLGKLYVRGVSVDLRKIFTQLKQPEVCLPRYRFQRLKYWFDQAATTSQPVRTTDFRGLTCHMKNCLSLMAESEKERYELQPDQNDLNFLKNHAISGNVLMPAAGFLYLLSESSISVFDSSKLCFDNIAIEQPLLFNDNSNYRLQIVYSNEGNKKRVVSLYSNNTNNIENKSSWQLHVSAFAIPYEEAGNSDRVSIEQIIENMSQEMSVKKFYAELHKIGFNYGPNFRMIKRIWSGHDESVSCISLKKIENPSNFESYTTIVDSCFQTLAASIQRQKNIGLYVPMSMGRYQQYRRFEETNFWAHCRIAPNDKALEDGDYDPAVIVANIAIYDEFGEIFASIDDLKLRKLSKDFLAKKRTVTNNDAFHLLKWIESKIVSGGNNRKKQKEKRDRKATSWLIFADKKGVGSDLSKIIKDKDEKVHLFYKDKEEINSVSRKSKNRSFWSGTIKSTIDTELDSTAAIRKIVYLWGLDIEHSEVENGESAFAATLSICSDVLFLVKELTARSIESKIQLSIVTNSAVAFQLEKSFPLPVHASLWGLGRTISVEHPELNVRMIDILKQTDAIMLYEELDHDSNEGQVLLREKGRGRYVGRLTNSVELDLIDKNDTGVIKDASYLISGGVGGLGALVAERLAANGARNLILIGRSNPNEKVQERVKILREKGIQLAVRKGDITSQREVNSIISEARCSMPPIKGVIHAAGVLDDGVLTRLSTDQMKTVLAPKLLGAYCLHEATKNLSLDFFVMFSSLASLIGSPGQGNYAAANAWLDGFAHFRKALGLTATSVNWGAWLGVGMAANRQSFKMRKESGLRDISVELGSEALDRIILNSPTQVGVFTFDWSMFSDSLWILNSPSVFSELASKHSEEKGGTEDFSIVNNILDKIDNITNDEAKNVLKEYLIEKAGRILGYEKLTFVNSSKSINEYGFDSLMAMELKRQILKELGIDLPLDYFVKGLSIEEIASHFLDKIRIAAIMDDSESNNPNEEELEVITL
ncbi:MAG: SDR family NAD(P)-dependent oxidoreductase [Myxococcota bacterium]|nr:SDR family NAD(P)-dependent oxidoreductase [Myxococcota bacterium]